MPPHRASAGRRPARTSALALLLSAALVACSGGGDADKVPAAAGTAPTPPSAAAVVQASPVSAPSPVPIATRTLQRVEVKGSPDFLAASGGLLWVKSEDGQLRGLDPATATVRRTVTVARNPGGINGNCLGLGGDERHLWTCSGGGVGLVAEGATVRPVPGVQKIPDQTLLPVVEGRVWVVEPDGRSIVGLRVADGSDPVRLPVDARCVDAAAGAGPFLWLACPTDGVGLRLDTSSGEAVRVPGLRDVREVSVAGAVFFNYRFGIARVDPGSLEVTGAVAVAGGSGLRATPEAVWLRGGGAFLQRLDPTSLAVVEQIAAPEPGGGSVLPAYGVLWATAYDDAALYRLRLA